MVCMLYYLQDEPGESEEVPNCLQIPNSSNGSIRFRDLQSAWPMKHGYFHFRFKVNHPEYGYLWQDIVNSEEQLPIYDGYIHAKVLRLDKPARPGNRLKVKAGSSAHIFHPGQDGADKGYGTGVGFLKNTLFGGKKHQPYSDEQPSDEPNNGRRVRAPSSAPQVDPNAAGGNNNGRRVRAPSSAPQVDPNAAAPSLNPGDVVEIGGLKARPDINGLSGRISSFDPPSGRYVVNVNGEVLKLKEANLKFLSAATADSMNPLNGQYDGEADSKNDRRPPAVEVQPVADLFSFDSNSPLHNGSNDANNVPDMFSSDFNSSSPKPSSGGGAAAASSAKSGDDRAAAVRARYEAMRAEQVAKGVLEWDPVEERYREKAGMESSSNEVTGQSGGVKIGLDNLSQDPLVAAGQRKRYEEMKQKQQAALAALEKRKQSENAEADAETILKLKLDPMLKEWSEEYGKKKNIRALLGGLHKVLWEGAKWKPVSIGDLVEDNRVVKQYRLASRVVHPDQTVKLDHEKRFIAKRVFDAITQALEEFNTQRGAS